MHFHLRHENLINSAPLDINNNFNFDKEFLPNYDLDKLHSTYNVYIKTNDYRSKN